MQLIVKQWSKCHVMGHVTFIMNATYGRRGPRNMTIGERLSDLVSQTAVAGSYLATHSRKG